MMGSACLSDEQIAGLAEGVLSAAETTSANEHLADCAECRRIVAEMASDEEPSERSIALNSTELDEPPVQRRRVDDRLPAGAQIGRYEVLELIGAGAMGTVYAALDPSLDRQVALKLLRVEATRPDLETRLLREAKAMARLNHPE